MKDCWICGQKEVYKNEKLKKALCEAKELALANGETMAVVKEGVLYKVKKASEVEKAVEYVSFNS